MRRLGGSAGLRQRGQSLLAGRHSNWGATAGRPSFVATGSSGGRCTTQAPILRCLFLWPPRAGSARLAFATYGSRAPERKTGQTSDEVMARVQRLQSQEEVNSGDVLSLLPAARDADPGLRTALLSLVPKIKTVNQRQANQLLHGFIFVPSSMEAARHVLELAKTAATANIVTLSHYARVATSNKKASEALAMQNLAVTLQLTPDWEFYSALIRACLAGQDLRMAFDLLQAMRQRGVDPTIADYTAVIQLCARSANVASALKVMGMVEADGLPFDRSLLTALLGACATKPKYAKRGFAVLSLMQQRGIVPDLIAYNALLRCCSVVDDISGMQHIFQLMKEQDMASDEATMRSLIAGQLKSDNLKGALAIVANFRTLGVLPSIKTYHGLFDVCKRLGDLDSALGFLEQMKEDHVEPDPAVYNSLVDIYAHRADFDNAQRLVTEMQERGVPPVASTVGSLLTAMSLRDGCLSEAAYQLVERMKNDHGVPPGLPTFTPAVVSFLRRGKIEEAWAVRKNMMERWDVEPDRVFNKVFLFALLPKRDVGKLEEIFDHMKTRPAAFFCHRMTIVLLCKHWLRGEDKMKGAMRTYDMLRALQLLNKANKVPTLLVQPAVVETMERMLQHDMARRAVELFRFLARGDSPPDFCRLFSMCNRPSHFPVFQVLRRHMDQRRVEFDSPTLLACLSSLCRMGRLHEAVHFLYSTDKGKLQVTHFNMVLRYANKKPHLARKTLALMEKRSFHGDSFTDKIREQLLQLPSVATTQINT